MTLSSLLTAAYETHAGRTALIDEDVAITFAELGSRTAAVRAALARDAVQPGDRIAVIANSRHEHLIVDHAAWIGGYPRVALNRRLHPREVLPILSLAGPKVVFCDGEWALKLAEYASELPALEALVCFDRVSHDVDRMPLVCFEDWCAQPPPRPVAPPQLRNEDLAALQFTSGTTGRPKAVMLTQQVLAAMVRNILIDAGATAADVLLDPLPFYQPGAFFALAHLIRGACVVIVDRFEPGNLLELAASHHATTVLTSPSMVAPLSEFARAGGVTLPALRSLIYGGSSIPLADILAATDAFGPVLVQMYGQTEAGLPLTTLSVPDHVYLPDSAPPERLTSAGRPNPYLQIQCWDAAATPVAAGDVGEVVVRGDTVMAGYWNDPDATREVLDPDGWFHTGDLGRFDAEGYLHLVGRKKDLVISGGFNVYPIEVEQVIAQYPGVAEVAVIGLPDPRWGEAVSAVIVPQRNATVDPDAIVAACRESLAGFKIPRRVFVMEQLPRNAFGKILKRELRATLSQ